MVKNPWLVCDATDRWLRTAHRFLHTANIPWHSVSPQEARVHALQHPKTIILWGLSPHIDRERLETLSGLSRTPHPPLQIVGLPSSVPLSAAISAKLQWQVRQLGAALILTAPEKFSIAVRLADRFRESIA